MGDAGKGNMQVTIANDLRGLCVADAAEALGVSAMTVYRLVARGKLCYTQDAQCLIRIPHSCIAAYIEANKK
jgi:excisionase family DNA binding protein